MTLHLNENKARTSIISMKSLYSIIFLLLISSCNNKNEEMRNAKINKPPIIIKKSSTYSNAEAINILNNKITEVKLFISKKPNYNNKIGFFIDMRIPSNKFRFFIVDLVSKTVLKKGLVAHGLGSNGNSNGEMRFSNEKGSKCTSLGVYAVGEYYYGRFGKSYRLYGKEKSNSNAIDRLVVLHKHIKVPDTEQASPIRNSEGCPMVSPQFYRELEKIIDNSTGNLILSIYY